MGILSRKPEIRDDLLYIWRAFIELSISRPASFSVGYIPLSELEVYCRIYNIEGEDMEFLLRVFAILDRHFIELTQAKNAATKK